MLRLTVALLMILVVVPALAQQGLEDVVYLKNGSIIRGIIVEQIPFKSIKISTLGGSELIYTMDEIVRITKEPPIRPKLPMMSGYNPVKPQSPMMSGYGPVKMQREKSPGLALGLSFLVVGAGQAYAGEYENAMGHGIVAISCIAAISITDDSDIRDVALIIGLGNWIWSMADAPTAVQRFNTKLRRTQRQLSFVPITNPDQLGAKLALRF